MGLTMLSDTPVSLEAAAAVLGGIQLPPQHFSLRLICHEPSNTWFLAMPFTGYLKPVEIETADEYVHQYNQEFRTLMDGWTKFETVVDRKGFKSVYLVYTNTVISDIIKRRLGEY